MNDKNRLTQLSRKSQQLQQIINYPGFQTTQTILQKQQQNMQQNFSNAQFGNDSKSSPLDKIFLTQAITSQNKIPTTAGKL